MRWLVLLSLLFGIFRAFKGYRSGSPFTKTDNAVRHWTATISHLQLVFGFTLYSVSPLVRYFFGSYKEAEGEAVFFGMTHMLLMFASVVVITLGSAFSKRAVADRDKFRIMLTWFSITLLIIFIAIPWPFSPLANRPYLRP
jgi:hypothetical protein